MRILTVLLLVMSLGCASMPGGAGGGSDGGGGAGGGTAGGGSGGGGGGTSTEDAGTDGGSPDCTVHAVTEVSIPMRDGKSLSALVRAAVDGRCRLPTVLIQTPYNKNSARTLWLESAQTEPLFGSKDYAFVIVDWRGFFGSTAARVPGVAQQPYGEDGYDTVEWIAAQPWSDGNVGQWGVSALCQQQYRTAVLKPPHLKASVPIFCQMNQTYAQYYPGGVLRREYLSFLSSYFGITTITQAPTKSPIWGLAEAALKPADVASPMLLVAGWFDLYPAGELETFAQLSAQSPAAAQHRLLIGPWIHFAAGGETAGGRALSEQELVWTDGAKRIQLDSRQFFDLHLRGQSAGAASQWAKVRYLRGTETEWSSSATWPPAGVTAQRYVLTADGGLATGTVTTADAGVRFVHDPSNPSPTLGGGTLIGTQLHGPTEQRAVLSRGDVAVFTSAPLGNSLRVQGRLALTALVSTTAADADLAARLTDVSPDGGQLLLAEGIRRFKLRTPAYHPAQTVTAGEKYMLEVPFTSDLGWTFAPGHRVGLILSGANAPRFDPNPGTGADFFPDAGSPLMGSTHEVFVDGPSSLTLDVAP